VAGSHPTGTTHPPTTLHAPGGVTASLPRGHFERSICSWDSGLSLAQPAPSSDASEPCFPLREDSCLLWVSLVACTAPLHRPADGEVSSASCWAPAHTQQRTLLALTSPGQEQIGAALIDQHRPVAKEQVSLDTSWMLIIFSAKIMKISCLQKQVPLPPSAAETRKHPSVLFQKVSPDARLVIVHSRRKSSPQEIPTTPSL